MSEPRERSIGEVLQDIVSNIRNMVRAEMATARDDATASLRAFAAAAVAGACAIGLIVLALVFLLATTVALWVSFLVVGAIVGGAAAVLFFYGRRELRQIHPPPEQTIETVKEELEWKTRHP